MNGDLVTRARSVLARIVAPAEGAGDAADGWYPGQPTCQIPGLSALYSRFLGDRTDGVFVEVGAYDGVFVSNTWGLAERGWTGLMVEPVPTNAEACRRNHAGHPRVRVVETAVGAEDDATVTLQLAGTLTTANTDAFEEYKSIEWAKGSLSEETVEVPSTTLDTLLATTGTEPGFDVLVVDVEGYEATVFSRFDLPRWRPKMLIVELIDTHPDLSLLATSDARLSRSIQETGYAIVFKDHINTVFVRSDVWADAYQLA